MDLVEIYPGIVKADVSLPCPVYDEAGTLLAQKGSVLTHDQVIGFVKYGKIYTEKSALLSALEKSQSRFFTKKPVDDYSHKLNSPFARLCNLEAKLSEAFAKKNGEELITEIKAIAEAIYNVCRGAHESSIAFLFVKHSNNLNVAHAIATAAVVFQITAALDWKEEERKSLLYAALTMNLSLGFELDSSPLPYEQLNPQQRAVYEQHPLESEKRLRAMGVNDEKWLEYVRCHHEQIDGSGYPRQLKQNGFSWGAQILSVAEAYCALVLGFGVPEPIFPNHAIKHVFQLRRHQPKDVVTQAFLKVLGHYPPGSIVQLANGEIAVVIRHGREENKPYVKAIFDRDGGFYHQPYYRNTAILTYSIADIIPTGTILFNIEYHKLW